MMTLRRRTYSHLGLVYAAPLVGASVLFFGCSSDTKPSDSSSGGSAGASSASGGGATAGASNSGTSVWGYVGIDMIPQSSTTDAHTNVLGALTDRAALPEFYKLSSTVGECQLLKPTAPFCEAICTATQTCSLEGVCVDNARSVNTGALSLSGLSRTDGTDSFSMSIIGTTYKPLASVSLEYPPCQAGDTVSLEATVIGAPFQVNTTCSTPLRLTGADPLPAESGKPLDVTWEAPASNSDSKVTIEVDVSHHGGSKGIIRCETADSGSFSIDGALMTELTNLGVTGFPNVTVTRKSAEAKAVGAGQIELRVTSYEIRQLSFPGIFSCTEDSECPAATPTCNLDTMVCE